MHTFEPAKPMHRSHCGLGKSVFEELRSLPTIAYYKLCFAFSKTDGKAEHSKHHEYGLDRCFDFFVELGSRLGDDEHSVVIDKSDVNDRRG